MTDAVPILAGKKGLITGVANERSLAWGIAKACVAHGAELAFTCQNEMMEKRVRPLAQSLGSHLILQCDATKEDDLAQTFSRLGDEWGKIDFVLHGIAFSHKEELKGRYVDTSPENFNVTLAASCYSFTAMCRHAQPFMAEGGSLITLTYFGSEKVIPHYNIMGVAKAALDASVRYLAMDLGATGVRVNAISAGPVRTLASSAIGDFRYILKWNELNSPLGRNVSIDEVGGAAVYLFSNLASAVTGEIHHVDSGYNVVGMKRADAPDISTAGNSED
jgi:enoyl-[acyl-carrier protein] reductase I